MTPAEDVEQIPNEEPTAQCALYVPDVHRRVTSTEVKTSSATMAFGKPVWRLRPQQETYSAHKQYFSPARPLFSMQQRPLVLLLSVLILLASLIPTTNATFINFQNCLDSGYRDADNPVRLQFVPLFVDARYIDSKPDTYTLNITVYGNVTGQAVQGPYPSPYDRTWSDDNNPFGKLVNFTSGSNLTTLAASADVLSYTPWPRQVSAFCDATVNDSCPIGPAFFKNASDPFDLPGFRVTREFTSSYAFTTFESEISIISGDRDATQLACIRAHITPDIGSKLANAFTYVPVTILIVVAIATLLAARFSPWSSPDPFYWSSNFGRDPDLLRLITPGFGDCLQYIQFIVLAGSLSLEYPGYYQPVVSQASWSTLLFNESFVSGTSGTTSLSDGVYFSNGSYGLTRMDMLVGMGNDSDAWAGMAVWLLVILAIVVLACQLWFFGRWVLRRKHNDQSSELRNRNIPFTSGMIVRICFNYFNLPILSLSLFQLVIAPSSPASVVACAVIMIVAFLASAGWIFRLIFSTKPRIQLFDHLPTLLAYGPVYNTYSDEAAPFAFIPVLLTFIRGAAIGAVQPSGIAQIVLLAICEVVFLLTLHTFRPFNAPTSMNAYHTFFSVVRLVTTLLMIAFAPTLNVTQATKGWIGYAILLLHAIVLIFGFFLNALQTLVEVAARLSNVGAGNRDTRGGLSKVFGMRQLSKRARTRNLRTSLTSDAAMLTGETDAKSFKDGGRSRSLSASSAILLQRPHSNSGKDRNSPGLPDGEWEGATSPGPSTPGATSPFSHLNDRAMGTRTRTSTFGSKGPEQDFYRPPRPRRPTLEAANALAGDDPRSPDSADQTTQPYRDSPDRDHGEGSAALASSPNRSSIMPAFLRTSHYSDNNSDPYMEGGQIRKPTDYAVRESDFYYGVRRGQALNAGQTRKLKTGPADPVGPVSSATGWFKGLFGGSKKEETKGFEVVRPRRFPLAALDEDADEAAAAEVQRHPYRDSPDSNAEGFDGSPTTAGAVRGTSQRQSDVESQAPQLLGPIDMGEELKMPSRVGSRNSAQSAQNRPATTTLGMIPSVPRRSSKRNSSMGDVSYLAGSRVSKAPSTAPGQSRPGSTQSRGRADPGEGAFYLQPSGPGATRSSTRLPFGGADFAADDNSSVERSPMRDSSPSTQGGRSRNVRESVASSIYPVSEGGTPIAGGEGAGFDDQSLHAPSRGGTQRSSAPPVPTVHGGSRSRGLSGASAGHVSRHLASDSVRDAASELSALSGSGRSWGGEEAEVVGGASRPTSSSQHEAQRGGIEHFDFQWAPR